MTQQAKNNTDNDTVIIKKYPNRRLYNTETSVYVTLDDLAELVKQGRDFTVQDAKTGEDLTRQVLSQIIFERESNGPSVLPINFLRSLIHFYDDNMNNALQHYLDASMQAFISNQEKFRNYASRAMHELSPLSQFEEMARQNKAFFEKTFSMFNPFMSMNPDDKKKK